MSESTTASMLFEVPDGTKVAVRAYREAELSGDVKRRELERLVAVELLRQLTSRLTEIHHDEAGAPLLKGYEGYISVSHCCNSVAVAYNRLHPIGIDIETQRPQLFKVMHKYLSVHEQHVWGRDLDSLLRAWGAKEALYKAALHPGLSLVDGINLPLDINDKRAVADGRIFNLAFFCPFEATILVVATPE